MQRAIDVQVARPITQEEAAQWHAKQGIEADESGAFTAMPYGDGPVTKDEILAQVEANSLRRDIPNMPTREYTPRIMVYVGGGPTLRHHLEEVKEKCESEKYDVFTSNKTASYLIEKGIKPNYHVIVDPTEKKVKDIEYDADVELVLGLQCHPALFERAKEQGRKVHKFLAASITTNQDGRTDREAAKEAAYPADPIIMGIGGGSMCGTRMLYFAAARGYRRIEFYGVDGNVEMKGQVVNCYAYFKPRGENIIETTASNGRTFHSTITLARQGEEIVQMMDILPGLDVEFYGDSLMRNQMELYREARRGVDYRISDEYRAMQRTMHATTNYGNSSSQHAARVYMAASQLARKLGACAILDYGSGPGLLGRSMRQAFADIPSVTLREYDPAIEGKDAEPEKADLLFCGDVLEHVEVECTDAVLRHISDLTSHLAIIIVALEPAKKTLPNGMNAHICLQKPNWWLSKLRRHFYIVEEQTTDKYLLAVCMRFPQ